MATFEGWDVALLYGIGSHPTPDRLRFLKAWAACERSNAHFNPLNTTLRLPGSVSFNRVGVQSYQDFMQGNAATLLTIRLPAYVELRRALSILSLPAVAIAEHSGKSLDTWGTGRARVIAALR